VNTALHASLQKGKVLKGKRSATKDPPNELHARLDGVLVRGDSDLIVEYDNTRYVLRPSRLEDGCSKYPLVRILRSSMEVFWEVNPNLEAAVSSDGIPALDQVASAAGQQGFANIRSGRRSRSTMQAEHDVILSILDDTDFGREGYGEVIAWMENVVGSMNTGDGSKGGMCQGKEKEAGREQFV